MTDEDVAEGTASGGRAGRRSDLIFVDEGHTVRGDSPGRVLIEIMEARTDRLPYEEKVRWQEPVTLLFFSLSFGEDPDDEFEIAGRPRRIKDVR